MDDYYSLLGIDADASVDDIRGAYRVRKDGLDTASDAGKADAAKLNKAWNVLSDPYQRGRYDEQRATAEAQGTLGVDDGDDTASSNGSGSRTPAKSGFKGLQQNAKGSREDRRQSVRDACAAKLNQAPTVTLPPGTSFPAPKNRIIAMVIDLIVLLVIFVLISQIGPNAVAKSQRPQIVDKVNQLNDQITAASKTEERRRQTGQRRQKPRTTRPSRPPTRRSRTRPRRR